MDTKIKSNVEGLELYNDTFPFRLALRIRNFENEVSYKKFLSNVEMLIRRCNEYKLWRNYIIDILQVNSCMITNESIDEVTIDVHHHVPSLFTLVGGLVNKKIEDQEQFCTFDIAREAIELHFKNKVGYVTLLKSIHEKFHNGYLDIPISMVKGDYNYFIDNYGKYLDDADIETIQSRLAVNEHNCSWAKNDYPASNMGAL
jgi:hypothetical protein